MVFLPRSFYLRETPAVAHDLVGKLLVRSVEEVQMVGRIVETEAYLGGIDPASHSFRGETARNASMFQEGGIAYVYFIYGNHYCLNAVTGEKGRGEGVLIRALEPVEGVDTMRSLRPGVPDRSLTNGPGKLCQALGITREMNGKPLDGTSAIGIAESDDALPFEIGRSARIGIREGRDLPLRFFASGSSYLSR